MGWEGEGPAGEGYQSPQDRAAARQGERERRLGGGGGGDGTFEIRGPSSPVTTPRAAAGVEKDIRRDDDQEPRRGGPATPGTGREGAAVGGMEQAAQTFLTTVGSDTTQWQLAGKTFGEAASQAMKATEIQLNANIGPLTINLTATDVLTQFKNVLMPSIETSLRKVIIEELERAKGALTGP